MTNKDKLITKIKKFFETSALKEYNLKDGSCDAAESFVLDEGDLFDTEVQSVSKEGVETDGYGSKDFEDLSEGDLQHLFDWVIEPIQTSEEKTMDKCRDNNF